MGSRGAAFLYLEALNLQAMATPAGSGRGGCQRRELLGMCAARRQNSVTQLLVYLSSCARTVRHQALLASKPHCEKALLPAPDRFPAFAAELALLLGDFDRGIPTHSTPLPPPLGLRRRQIGECRCYITASMNVVGVAGGIVLSERSSCARKLAPLPQKLLKKYFTIALEA